MSDTESTEEETEATDAPEAEATEEVVEAPAEEVAAPAAAAPASEPAEEVDPGRAVRKVREGKVVSNAMNKTAVVLVTDRVRHPRYNKTVQRSKKLAVHDETDTLKLGDIVRVMETRPLSKTKRWRLVEVIERAR